MTRRVVIDSLYAEHAPHDNCNVLAEMEFLRLTGVIESYTLMAGQVTSIEFTWYWLTLQAAGAPYNEASYWERFAGTMTLDQMRTWREREAERLVAQGAARAISGRRIIDLERSQNPVHTGTGSDEAPNPVSIASRLV